MLWSCLESTDIMLPRQYEPGLRIVKGHLRIVYRPKMVHLLLQTFKEGSSHGYHEALIWGSKMWLWCAGEAQGVASFDAQGCSCSSKGASQRARRSFVILHAAHC